MKKLLFILTLLILASACNKTDTVRPELQEDIQEMNEEKAKDPRHFDKDREKDQDMREVKRGPMSTNEMDPDRIIWSPANN